MILEINYIKWLQMERARINRANLHDIKFYKNGKRLNINPKVLEKFEFTGLSNIDFISSGFYEEEGD